MRNLALILGAVALLACGGKSAGDDKLKTYPDGADGLKALIGDYSKAVNGGSKKLADELEKSLVADDTWFTKNFETAIGAKLAAEYTGNGKAGEIAVTLVKAKKKGLDEIVVEKHDKQDDPMATGYQSFALADAKAPLALYSVRLRKQGDNTRLYSFVYEGGWKYVGHMKEVKGKSDDEAMDAVSELRSKDREAFFKDGAIPDEL